MLVYRISGSGLIVIYHYWLFNFKFKIQDSLCIGCHDLMVLCFKLRDIPIISVKNLDYCCVIHDINKSEGNYLKENPVFGNSGYI